MKEHRICLYSRYCKHPSAKEIQTNQPRLMWNLQPPWDTAKISCFSPSPDSIHMLTVELCKALSPKKESFFLCPVFVLHKIRGFAAMKGTKPKPKGAGWAQEAEQELAGSDALARREAATLRGRGGAASGPERCTHSRTSMAGSREGGLPGIGWTHLGTQEGVCRKHSRSKLGGQRLGRGWPSQLGQGAGFQCGNHATCGCHTLCQWEGPASPSQVDERHLLVWWQLGWGLDSRCWLSAALKGSVSTDESLDWDQTHPSMGQWAAVVGSSPEGLALSC